MEWTTTKPEYIPSIPIEWNRKTQSWDNVWSCLQQKLMPVPESGCWIWLGATKKYKGEEYGIVYIAEKAYRVHRIMYEFFRGPLSDELVLDHLCRVHCCANPYHLDQVTDAINIKRGFAARGYVNRFHCKRGHLWAAANLREYKGRYFCRACERERSQRRRDAAMD